MRRHDDSEDEPLVDTTASLPRNSKKLARLQKKRAKKVGKKVEPASLQSLPTELLLEILRYLRPSDLFRLARTNRSIHGFINEHASFLAREVIHWRYPILAQCFPLPVLLSNVEADLHPILLNPQRQELTAIHKRPYQHISPPDPSKICTCLTCLLTWNNINLAVDFAHWQRNLENGVPIPIIPRGRNPEWNRELVESHTRVVEKALGLYEDERQEEEDEEKSEDGSGSTTQNAMAPLWYALILETHLASTTRSIRRHHKNRGNKRRKFNMTDADAASETDAFLLQSGPPSLEFPFHRDEYYMLAAYLPNRWWRKERDEEGKETGRGSWVYHLRGQHEKDLDMVRRWAGRWVNIAS